MKNLMHLLFVGLIVLSGCKKDQNADENLLKSIIKVEKNNVKWADTAATATLNAADEMISILASDGLETFTIRFRKPLTSINVDAFDAGALLSPFLGSAAIADAYYLDTTQNNKFRILVFESLTQRVAGDFFLHLKRHERYGVAATYIYQGRFDVRYNKLNL